MHNRWDALPAYLSLRQVAELFGVHPNTVRNWERSGRLTAVKISSRGDRRFDKEVVYRLFTREYPRVEGRLLQNGRVNGAAQAPQAPVAETARERGTPTRRNGTLRHGRLPLWTRTRAYLTNRQAYRRWKQIRDLADFAPQRRIPSDQPPPLRTRASAAAVTGVLALVLLGVTALVVARTPLVRRSPQAPSGDTAPRVVGSGTDRTFVVATVSGSTTAPTPESPPGHDEQIAATPESNAEEVIGGLVPETAPSPLPTPQPTPPLVVTAEQQPEESVPAPVPESARTASAESAEQLVAEVVIGGSEPPGAESPVAATLEPVPETVVEPGAPPAIATTEVSKPEPPTPSAPAPTPPSETADGGVVAGAKTNEADEPAVAASGAAGSKPAPPATLPVPTLRASPAGLALAWISLIFGTFFFLYSFRYYSIVAVVLALSRSGGSGNGYANGNANGYTNGNGYKNGNGANGNSNGAKGFLAGFFKKKGSGKGFRPGFTGLANGNGAKKTRPSFLYNLFFGDESSENGNGKNGGNGYANGNGKNGGNGYANGNGNGNGQKGYRVGYFGANGKNGNGRTNGYKNGNGNGYRPSNGYANGNGKAPYLRFFQGLFKKNGSEPPKNGNGYGNGNGYRNGNGHAPAGMWWDLSGVELKDLPFVSVHIPFYNEKKVANRILTATTSFDYPNYEVIVVDDSTDETVQILEKWKRHPKVKVIHRDVRTGFKGGALRQAVAQMDPRTAFVVVFDADFVPYPDTLTQFLRYFRVGNGHAEDYKSTNLAAVQGYQWHVLNKNENWITRAVRAEFAGSYVIERPGTEIFGALKQIAGSVYMIRADVLKKYGWGTSITEDFELTLKLYADGYRVLYTPYVQGPSECVSTLKRLIRQRMRWAEGHTHNIRLHARKILGSPYLRRREKLEFLYLAPYYLQAAFFMVGTLAWFVSDAVLHTKLPFWTELWGWSLVFTNLFALPLVNAVGLFLEESPQRDYLGIGSFLVLSYVLVPFQAWAALKGLVESSEGPWFRTPKSGHITDAFFRSRFRRWFGSLFPGTVRASVRYEQELPSHYLDLGTSNNTFRRYAVEPAYALPRRRNLARGLIAGLLIVTVTSVLYIKHVPYVSASPDLFYGITTAIDGSPAPGRGNALVTTTPGGAGTTRVHNSKGANITANNWWYFSNILPTGAGDASIASGTWSADFNILTSNVPAKNTVQYGLGAGIMNDDGSSPSYVIATQQSYTSTGAESATASGSTLTITAAVPKRIFLILNWINTFQCTASCVPDNNESFRGNYGVNRDTAGQSITLTTPTVTLPEINAPRILVLLLIFMLPFLPRLVRRRPPGPPGGGLPDWRRWLAQFTERLLGRPGGTDDLPV
jgi:cellulose synthase/poly-beta-1,6-N-acetylglucosamine synthase-like glycosyltransferase